jgi:hypothetical protein
MSYDAQQEKQRLYDLLSPVADQEKQLTKKHLFNISVGIALDEIDEFEKEYKKFLEKVNHLQVYQEVIKQPLVNNMDKIIRDLRFLIEKNYTEEELEKMPADVYEQVVKSQKQRVEILKKVANIYLKNYRKE